MGPLVNRSVRLPLHDNRAQQLVDLSLEGRALVIALAQRPSQLYEFRTRIHLAQTGPEDRPTELRMVSNVKIHFGRDTGDRRLTQVGNPARELTVLSLKEKRPAPLGRDCRRHALKPLSRNSAAP